MWVARDSNGDLFLYKTKPERVYTEVDLFSHKTTPERVYRRGYWEAPVDINNDVSCEIFNDLFPNLKWEDEPIEVELISKEVLERYKASQVPSTPYLGV